MNGIQLSRVVEARSPATRLVMTPGRLRFRDEDLPDHGKFLPKPYPANQLGDAVRAQLARR